MDDAGASRDQAQWMDDAHALVIGIARYRHVPALPPTKDAQDVAAALVDPSTCGYPAANVRTLLDDEATGARIAEELARLSRVTSATSTVLVYFSGHGGTLPPSRESFLLPVDADGQSRDALMASVLGAPRLSAALSKIGAARLTVVLDCCSAFGAATVDIDDGEPPSPLSSAGLAPLARGRGRVVIAASPRGGASYVLPGDRNGLFTGALLAGLRGGALGAGGVLRVCDLFDYVQRRLVEVHAGQRPMFRAELEENYPIALCRGGRAATRPLPPPPDDFPYDAFVSYCEGDRADEAWVWQVLVPALEGRGLRLFVPGRDFRLGRGQLRELGRAVTSSRYTLGVFSQAYLDGPFEAISAELAQYWGVQGRRAHLLPLQLRPCQPPAIVRMLRLLDVSADLDGGAPAQARLAATLDRLALALREPADL